MTANEFAFLALGLVLGLGVGAAAVVLMRARPPTPREVRLTVTPASIPRRSSTLAVTELAVDPVGPAPGGPGDRREVERDDAPAVVPARQRTRTLVRNPVQPGGAATAPAAAATAPAAAGVATLAASSGWGPGVTSHGPHGGRILGSVALTDPVGGLAGDREPVGIAIEPDTDPGLPLEERSPFASADERGADVRAEGADGPGPGAMTDDGSLGQAVPVRDEPSAIAAADETCADERKASEERCAAADRLLEQAEAAQARLREAQRTADGHQARATEAGLLADPRAIRSSKEAAQLAFRNARAVARSADAVEAAARTWLQEINRVNHAAREASVVLRHEQEAANALAPVVERLSLEADAARITAEAARESCIAAREALAGCEEAAAAANRAPRARPGVHEPASPEPTAGEAASPGPAARETAAAVRGAGGGEAASAVAGEAGDGGTGEVLEPGLVAPADRDGLPALFRLLHGERQAMTRIVDQLSGNDPADRRRWQLQLSDLVDALLARAIESAVLDFPAGHSFWGLFSRDESRDIAGALASLGYRFDGLGGFVDGRVPSQRDLSLALGFAGLDPMRIRRWPSETEMAGLYREVTVAADEYVAGAAGSLSLGELVTVLGRRADGLTDLWNNWGRVRPLLVASD